MYANSFLSACNKNIAYTRNALDKYTATDYWTKEMARQQQQQQSTENEQNK